MYVREHWRAMEALPFDRIDITVVIDRSRPSEGTGNKLGWNLFGPTAYRIEDFRPAITDLRVPEWHKFTENFLPAVIASSGQNHCFNRFDDAHWQTILNNWRVFVTIAKEGGCKGIIIDPEDYQAPIFDYPAMRRRVDQPFAAYAAEVRQRGRELANATREVFPDITILMFWARSRLATYKGFERS